MVSSAVASACTGDIVSARPQLQLPTSSRGTSRHAGFMRRIPVHCPSEGAANSHFGVASRVFVVVLYIFFFYLELFNYVGRGEWPKRLRE
jgi:hypothetical protein